MARCGVPAVASEGGLPEAEAHAMRRWILASAAPRHPMLWNSVLAVLPLALALMLGVMLRERLQMPPASGHHAITARQLYFETAGGTRVIWTLTPNEGEK